MVLNTYRKSVSIKLQRVAICEIAHRKYKTFDDHTYLFRRGVDMHKIGALVVVCFVITPISIIGMNSEETKILFALLSKQPQKGECIAEEVKHLINNGAAVNQKDGTKDGLLHRAIQNHHGIETLKVLLGYGALVNEIDRFGCTPLHIAAREEYVSIIELLMEYKADINVRDTTYHTPLRTAVNKGNKEVVVLLLKCNADLDNDDEDSALSPMFPAKQTPVTKEIAKILLLAGVKAQSRYYRYALKMVEDDGFFNNRLLRSVVLNEKNEVEKYLDNVLVDESNITALMYAAAQGHSDMVTILLNMKKSNDTLLYSNNYRQTVFDILTILLRRTWMAKEGKTYKDIACRCGKKLFKLLLLLDHKLVKEKNIKIPKDILIYIGLLLVGKPIYDLIAVHKK